MIRHRTIPKAFGILLGCALWSSGACVDSAALFSDGTKSGSPLGDTSDGGRALGGQTQEGGSGSSAAESGGSGAGADGAGGNPASGGASGGSNNLGGASLAPGPLGQTLAVSAGDTHSCGIADGTLYCWGDNDNGALGLGDEGSRDTPTMIAEDKTWRFVECGGGFTCGATEDGLFCWGDNASGQLGVGRFTSHNEPALVVLPSIVSQLSVGHHHVCAVLDDGGLWCWGNNTEGQLGQDDPFPGPGVNEPSPVQVGSETEWSRVSGGDGHSCAIRQSGELYCWGRNLSGELGLGEGAPGQIRVPQRVGNEADWIQVAAGHNHTCGVRSDGALWCWGGNASGQLGLAGNGPYFEPTLVKDDPSIAAVATNTFHTCTLDAAGRARCFGRNMEGQLGDGTTIDSPLGSAVRPGDGLSSLALGRFHTCAVRAGAFLCTGENKEGRLGTGDRERRSLLSATQLVVP